MIAMEKDDTDIKRKPGRPRGFDRDAALDAAMRTFWAHGYETTSISDLTAAMSINAPALYSAFGDKKRLFLEALVLYRGDPEAEAEAISAAPTAGDAARMILFGAIERFTGDQTPKGCLIASSLATGSPASEDVRAEAATIRQSVAENLRQRIARDARDGILPDGADTEALAGMIVCTVQGLSALARDGAPRARLERIATAVLAGWPDREAVSVA